MMFYKLACSVATPNIKSITGWMPPIGGKLCGNSPVTNSTVESQDDDHQTQKTRAPSQLHKPRHT